MGAQKAGQDAQANLAACKALDDLITTRGIDCDWQRQNAYVYGDDPAALDREARAAALLGLPADRTDASSLPFPAAGAVRFSDQAQFHPLKFVSVIAKGLHIYEHTRVRELIGTTAVTNHGRICAKKIIVTTHFPFLNKHGSYFLKLYQPCSYVFSLKNAPEVDSMYLFEEQEGISFPN